MRLVLVSDEIRILRTDSTGLATLEALPLFFGGIGAVPAAKRAAACCC